MTDPHTPRRPRRSSRPVPESADGLLIAALIVFAVLVFAAAGLAWAGVVIIIALMAGAYTVLIRWSR